MIPEVSVVLPTYNRAETLPRAIDSVLSQTLDDIELIVVDDCSDDDTKHVVSQYDESVEYLRHQENRGAPAARNTGIKASQGNFVAFIDSDDEWKPGKLKSQLQVFKNSKLTPLGAVYTGFKTINDGQEEIGTVPSKRGDIFTQQLMKDWVNPTSTVMVKSRCFEDVGLFDSELPARQDYDMWLRISRQFKFDYVKEPVTILHTDSSNRITGDIGARMDGNKEILEKIKPDIESLGYVQRRHTWGYQYYTMGRFAQLAGRPSLAQSLLLRSLCSYPLYWKTWFALFIGVSPIDADNKYLLSAKNIWRNLRW
ncbi:glycosyltransferase family 2 protein [Salinirubellus salinus]|uniref:Glycosyltransferase family 2 protein n=1 Tax=Salinirubellus salinus TaxID=1364945 RepID=A0A9E7QZX6_9EURY|nr:glycosyltransferase family A protein [Salinirubellus salinus]UWM52749.1 glycosyltransferase family 2 protein [Salinirubellus salinus]